MIATVLTNISYRYELKGIFAFRSGCGSSELAPGILLLLLKKAYNVDGCSLCRAAANDQKQDQVPVG
jgi:hypothetical protein